MKPQKPFQELTDRGQLRRLHRLAADVLRDYDLDVLDISILAVQYNVLYTVTTKNGSRFVLRLSKPNERPTAEILSELWWLQELTRGTDLVVPLPVAARDGRLVIERTAPGVPDLQQCVLFTYVPGRTPGKVPKPSVARRLGVFIATLHNHADQLRVPEWFTRERIDTVWTFGRPDPIYSDQPHEALSPRLRDLLRETADRGEHVLARLFADTSGIRLCHFDLHPTNIRIQGTRSHVLDFDDCAWAYPIQDMSISEYVFHFRSPDTERLRHAFLSGYTTLRPLPSKYEEQINTLVDVRIVDLMNLWLELPALQQHPDRLREVLDRAERILRRQPGAASPPR